MHNGTTIILRKSILLIFLLLISFSCKKDDSDSTNACAGDNPLEADWMAEIKNSLGECTCELSILQGTYEGETVFYLALTDPLCDGIYTPVLMDCEGNTVKTYSIDEFEDFLEEVTYEKAIYRCPKPE